MMTLVDTSVWIDHFKNDNANLVALLENGEVLTHPYVIGELALGKLKHRQQIFRDLATLPQALKPEFHEIAEFIENHQLAASGIGWVDVSLLASARLTNCKLLTMDKKLQQVLRRL